MKKIVLSFFLSIIAFVANAQQEGMYSITQEIKAKPGQQATMVVNLKNTIKFSGIQMKIKLPDGVEVAYDEDDAALLSLNSSRAKGFSTGVTYNPTTRLYYIDISHESKGIEPSEGEIFSLTFNVGKNAQLGTQNIEFTACEFADVDLVSYDQVFLTVPLIIYDDFSVSATTANETMGSVKIEPSGDAVESGTSITATATPNDGYSFVNWTSGETEVSTDNPYTFELAAATALTANFKANQYSVVFMNDGAKVKNDTIDFASVITAPENPTKAGYTFLGWFDGNDVKFVEGATVPLNGVTYTAKWQINQYTITFDTDGGSEIAAITQNYNTAVTAPAAPTKTGYKFVGWDNEIPATMPAKNITIKATWQINQYTLSFDLNGGESEAISDITADYNSDVTKPADPTRTGYKFLGWYPEFTGKVPAADTKYTAQWELDIVKVRFVFWDGNTKEYEYKPGAEITEIPEVPAREGYTFKGWDKKIEIGDVVPVVGGVLEITAQWSINKYAVYFIANKKTVYSAILPYGSEIVAPEAPEVEGYTFVGWTPEVDATVPARTVYYEAVYEVNTYKVTYYLNDEVVNVAEVKYGEAIPAYEPTVEEGMKFDGWQEEIPAVMPAYDLEIHGTTSGIETAIKNIVAKFGETFDVYNVSGRLVQRVNGASDISRIPAGMYIINGTKVVIRKD